MENTGRLVGTWDNGVVIVIVVSTIIGAAMAYVATWRSRRQPIAMFVDAERTVLSAVLTSPDWYRDAVALDADTFTVPRHRDIWRVLENLAVDSDDQEFIIQAEKAGLPAKHLPENVRGDIVETLNAALGGKQNEQDALVSQAYVDDLYTQSVDKDDFKKAGQLVLDASEDRQVGAAGVRGLEQTGDDNVPLRWQHQRTTLKRVVIGGVLGMLGGVLASGSGLGGYGQAAIVVLVAGSLALSFIDVDTLFIDLPTLALTAVVGYALAIASNDNAVLITAISVGIIVVLLLLTGWVYQKVRGTSGLGGGDLQLIVITFGLPLLLTGSAQLAIMGLVAASGLAVLVRLSMVAIGRTTFATPFALGPYLCGGWVVGWVIVWGL